MTHARPGHSLIGTTTRSIQGRAGVEANARLTAMTGIVLLVLFIAEIATVLIGARRVLTLHVTLGLLLVPPVLLKIASTTWRMAAYYRGNTAYRREGAAHARTAHTRPLPRPPHDAGLRQRHRI